MNASKKRLLITASTLPRWEADSVPAFVLDQALSLSELDSEIDIHILAPHDQGAALEERVGSITIHRFRYFWPDSLQRLIYPAILPNLRTRKWLVLLIPFLLFFETVAIYRLCRKLRPGVLYSHWFVPQALCGALVSWLLSIPHVFTSHSSDVKVMHSIPVLGPWLVRKSVEQMRACSVVSQRSLEKLQSFFSESAWRSIAPKVKVIPMGVYTAQLGQIEISADRARRELGLQKGVVILFIGRLSEKKGIPYLLQAFEQLANSNPDAQLVIAGDGEIREEISSLIESMQLGGRVFMPGYVTGELKDTCFAAADIVAVPSIITSDGDAEGLPVSLMEGLAAGKICVATYESGADDIITNEVDGFLIPEKSTADLRNALQNAIQLDETKRALMIQNGKQTVKQLDWAAIAKRYRDHLLALNHYQ